MIVLISIVQHAEWRCELAVSATVAEAGAEARRRGQPNRIRLLRSHHGRAAHSARHPSFAFTRLASSRCSARLQQCIDARSGRPTSAERESGCSSESDCLPRLARLPGLDRWEPLSQPQQWKRRGQISHHAHRRRAIDALTSAMRRAKNEIKAKTKPNKKVIDQSRNGFQIVN